MAGEKKVDRRLNNPKAGRPPGRKNNKTIQMEERVAKQKATIAKNMEQQIRKLRIRSSIQSKP